MLDQVSALVDSLPKDRIPDLLDETFKAFNGAGPDFGSLLDSASTVTEDVNGVSDQTRALIDDAGHCWIRRPRPPTRSGPGHAAWPASPSSSCRTTRSSAAILQRGPGFAQEVSGTAQSGEADAADPAGEPHHGGSDPA